jgi:tight adherence protein C
VFIVLIFGVFLIGAAAAFVARAIAMPRLRALERVDQIGAYGFRPQEAAAVPGRALAGALEGVAKTLGTFFTGRLKGLSEAEMRRELVAAGLYRISPVTIVGYRVLSAASFPATFLWFASTMRLAGGLVVLMTPLMLAVGWLAPVTIVRRRARFRLARIDADLPELVDLLVVTVESGMGFAGSMRVAADRFTGPLGDELRLALQEQSMGLSTDEALAHMLERADTPGMRSFVRSIRQGESLGVSIGQIMRNLAVEMRKRRRALAEEKAQKAPIKILFPLVGLIFPAIFVVLLVPAFLSFAESFGGG